jgi:hypothetical protein
MRAYQPCHRWLGAPLEQSAALSCLGNAHRLREPKAPVRIRIVIAYSAQVLRALLVGATLTQRIRRRHYTCQAVEDRLRSNRSRTQRPAEAIRDSGKR